MDSTLKTALQADAPTIWHAVELVYPDFTLRLCDAGFVTIGGHDFAAEDATYGVLGGVETFRDGGQDVASTATIRLLPPTAEAMRALTAKAGQMSKVKVYTGAVDPATGLAVGTPEEPFVGYVDFGAENIGPDGWSVTLECITGEDRALDTGEGHRLSDPHHQAVWPGEKGLAFVTSVAQPVWWGVRPPAGSGRVVTGGGLPPITPARPVPWARV